MIFQIPPKDFSPKLDSVGCIYEARGKILLLRRVKDDNYQGKKWGAPGGKREKGEKIEEAIVREFKEETGKALRKVGLVQCGHFFVRYPDMDFTYNLFKTSQPRQFTPILEAREHDGFQWVSPAEALNLDLILDMDLVIKRLYKI